MRSIKAHLAKISTLFLLFLTACGNVAPTDRPPSDLAQALDSAAETATPASSPPTPTNLSQTPTVTPPPSSPTFTPTTRPADTPTPTPQQTAVSSPTPTQTTAPTPVASPAVTLTGATWQVLDGLGADFTQVEAGSKGEVWAVGRAGLVNLSGNQPQITPLPDSLADNFTITDLAIAPDRAVWLSTGKHGVLYRYEEDAWYALTPADGLPADIWSITVDPQNTLWLVTTTHRFFHFDGQTWQELTDQLENEPDEVVAGPAGDIWVTGDEGSVHHFDDQSWQRLRHFRGIRPGLARVAVNGAGQVWLGTESAWHNWRGGMWRSIYASIPAQFAQVVTVDGAGGAWGIAMNGYKSYDLNQNGAVYVSPDRACRFTVADGLGGPPLDPPPDPFDPEPRRPDAVWDIAVGGDGRVWFVTQGKLTLFQPPDEVCDAAQPGQVRTPTPPNCSQSPAHFADLWTARQLRLRCPDTATEAVSLAEQAFEGGWMVWRGDSNQIIVLLNNDSYFQFEDTWQAGQPDYSCPDLSPTQTPPTPVRGFGKIWCEQADLRQALGLALDPERGFEGAVQGFSHGSILGATNGPVYILDEQGDWERSAP